MTAYLSAAEVAKRLGLPYQRTLAMLRSEGCPFPVVRPQIDGGKYRVLRTDLERYQAEGTQQPPITLDVIRSAVRAELLDLLDPALLKRELRAVYRRAS